MDSSYRITLLPANESFICRENQLILDAALEHQANVAYSCRNGTCRTCIFEVLEGDVEQQDADQCLISAQELELRRRLICMSTARSDAVLLKRPPRLKS